MVATQKDEPLLVVIVGPTASGKTALSLALARELGGEIVSCDSVAVYRGMDVGSAKPTAAERAQVPHHMIDVATPSVEYTAGDYGRAARAAVHEIAARGRVPIVAGGTGLYLRALLDGLSDLAPRDVSLRHRLQLAAERRGSVVLSRALRRLDPGAAQRIHANDAPKLIRAIEVCVQSRSTLDAAWNEQQPEALSGFRVIQMGLEPDRAELYRRINTRCQGMFAQGLVKETRGLITEHGADCRALRALGYAQAQDVLNSLLSEKEAITETQTGHRNYSKRQRTWFKRDPRIHWLQGFGGAVVAEALRLVRTQMNEAPRERDASDKALSNY